MLWVRSHYRVDLATYIHSNNIVLHANSLWGRFMLVVTPISIIDAGGIQSYAINQSIRINELPNSFLGFCFYHGQNSTIAVIPYWSAALLTGTLTAAPWIPRRFSLRTLLIATTLVAMVLGLIVILSRQ